MELTDKDKHLVEEALNLGASERLLVDYFVFRGRWARPPAPERPENVQKTLAPLFTAFHNKVSAEFQSLPKGWFADPDGERTPEQHYSYMRVRYYMVGFNSPAQTCLLKIRRFAFLGKNVPGGVHEAMVPGLTQVAFILDNELPGLSARVAAVISSQDGGFVPRKIAGSSDLSNHAFGLAIDIDPPTNPHVKGKVIPLLNEVVKRKAGLDFDFGSSYGSGKDWSGVLSDERRLKVTYLYASRASKAVQGWLQENMGTYDQCVRDVAAGGRAGATAADKANTQQAQMAIDNERDLQLIRLLEKETDRATLDQWRQHGIQSLPYELVSAINRAFAANPCFRWGQEYQSSKDAMHFELQAVVTHKDGSITPATLTPDVKRVRYLDDLFPVLFLATCSPAMEEFAESKQTLVTQPVLPPRTYR